MHLVVDDGATWHNRARRNGAWLGVQIHSRVCQNREPPLTGRWLVRTLELDAVDLESAQRNQPIVSEA